MVGLIFLWLLVGYASSFGLIYVANKYANTVWTIGDLAYALFTGLFGPLVVVAIVISSLLFTAGNVNWQNFFNTPLFAKAKEDKTLIITLPYSHYANLVFKSRVKGGRIIWCCELEDETIKDLEKVINKDGFKTFSPDLVERMSGLTKGMVVDLDTAIDGKVDL